MLAFVGVMPSSRIRIVKVLASCAATGTLLNASARTNNAAAAIFDILTVAAAGDGIN
jgi:hypothetical protein